MLKLNIFPSIICTYITRLIATLLSGPCFALRPIWKAEWLDALKAAMGMICFRMGSLLLLSVLALGQSPGDCSLVGLASAPWNDTGIVEVEHFSINSQGREVSALPFGYDSETDRRAILVASVGAKCSGGKTVAGVSWSIVGKAKAIPMLGQGVDLGATFFMPHKGRFIVGDWYRVSPENCFRSVIISLLNERSELRQAWVIEPDGKPRQLEVNKEGLSRLVDRRGSFLAATALIGWEGEDVRLVGSFRQSGVPEHQDDDRSDRLIAFDGKLWTEEGFSGFPQLRAKEGKKRQRRSILDLRLARLSGQCRAIGVAPCRYGADFAFSFDWIEGISPIELGQGHVDKENGTVVLDFGFLTPSYANPLRGTGIDVFHVVFGVISKEAGLLQSVKKVVFSRISANGRVNPASASVMEKLDFKEQVFPGVNSILSSGEGERSVSADYAFRYHSISPTFSAVELNTKAPVPTGESIELPFGTQFLGRYVVVLGSLGKEASAFLAPNICMGFDVTRYGEEPFTVVDLNSQGAPLKANPLDWSKCFSQSAILVSD